MDWKGSQGKTKEDIASHLGTVELQKKNWNLQAESVFYIILLSFLTNRLFPFVSTVG